MAINHQLQHQINRLLSGRVPCKLSKRTLFIHPPTPDIKHQASILEQELLTDAKYLGLITKEKLFAIMLSRGLWSIDEENRYQAIPSQVETMKQQMWHLHSRFASKKVEQVRKNMIQIKQSYTELAHKKMQYDIFTVEGFAVLSRYEYIIAHSTYDIDGNVPDDINDGRLIQTLVNMYLSGLLGDTQTRQVAKSNEWKMLWAAGKTGVLFDRSAAHLTEEQISIINWSRMYDSVYESPDCPGETVLDDDDLLDGWLITQSKKRESDRNQRLGDNKGGNKPGLQEVFVPAETSQDADRIDAMNDPGARATKQQRLRLAQKHGQVKEQNMPDAQLTMRQQALLEANQRMKGK
jgi:hypothetical protein